MCAKFGDPRSRDRKLRYKKTEKMRLLAWKFINSLITQKLLGVHGLNSHAMWVIINGLCKPSLGKPGLVTKMLQAEKGQKVDDFELKYLGNYRFW